jgi:hypothetical protein
MVAVKLGYYIRDTGDGDVRCYYMADEPPDGQFAFRGGAWVPLEVYGLLDGARVALVDGCYVMDRLIDGDPEFDGPFDDPPSGVPPFEAPAGDEPPLPLYSFLDGDWKPLVQPYESPPAS